MNLPNACLVGLLAAFAAPAQRPGPIVSPEVHPDYRVTFRIKAPKASEVTLTGDWLGSAEPPKLTKDDQGVWSVTLGPFEPSIYIYSFTVDGVSIPDPTNPRMKLGASTSASLLEVAGDPASGKRAMCRTARWKSTGRDRRSSTLFLLSRSWPSRWGVARQGRRRLTTQYNRPQPATCANQFGSRRLSAPGDAAFFVRSPKRLSTSPQRRMHSFYLLGVS